MLVGSLRIAWRSWDKLVPLRVIYSKEIVEIMKTGESIEHTQRNAYIRHLKVIFPVKP